MRHLKYEDEKVVAIQKYIIALQKDIERQKQEAYKAEIDKLYSQKLSNSELDKIRLARLNRFG